MSLRDIRRQIGQLAIVGFEGPEVPAELRALARDFTLGGVILFARNIEAPDQVAELAGEARTLCDPPLWVSVDQEGGRVARLRAPFTEWPPMATLGRSGDEALAARFADALAAELAAVGISLDFAPVLDVHTNPANPVIGDRALADDAETVARLGRVIIRGLQTRGIAACGKHFPGHGDTSVDSHVDLPVIEHPPERLRAVELVPFRAAIEEEVAFLMTAHVLLPAFDDQRPATLSERVVGGLLREECGYDGLVASDDLEMGAIRKHQTAVQAAVAAVKAGCDTLLLCGGGQDVQAEVLEGLIHAAETGEIGAAVFEDALARHRRAKERFMRADRPRRTPERRRLSQLLGCEQHQAVAADMARYL